MFLGYNEAHEGNQPNRHDPPPIQDTAAPVAAAGRHSTVFVQCVRSILHPTPIFAIVYRSPSFMQRQLPREWRTIKGKLQRFDLGTELDPERIQ